jgi:[acyl-carrier-protein] S-malonyltransferase
MAKDVIDQFPYSAQTFEEAEEASKCNIRKLCLEGPEDELRLTANAQPCILTVSVAIWRVLQKEIGISCQFFAGHSLGEYSALVASGKLDLDRAAYLVRKRGEAMQRAVPEGVGAMAAVMGCPIDQLEQECLTQSSDQNFVQIANYNMDQQTVVAGHKEAVERLCTALGSKGLRTVMLPVSAPFHSKLMGPARDEMRSLLNESTIHRNDNQIVANLTGSPVTDYTADFLIDQIDHPVLWTKTLQTTQQMGIDTYLEVGPGKVLTGFVRRAVPRDAAKCFATDPVSASLSAIAEHIKA